MALLSGIRWVSTGWALAALLMALPLGVATASNLPDSELVAEHLAGAIRFETISPADPADFKGQPFRDLAAYLRATYPRVHAELEVEAVAEYSLLFKWRGRDSSLSSVLFMSHLDVVPVEPGTEEDWTHPPFAGAIADGIVWGRGALDVKVGVIVWLEAVEALLADGFRPERTLYLAFGHDEEIGGLAGAANIAKTLEARGVRLAFLFDEGGMMGNDNALLPGRETAMVFVAEKTFLTLKLTARGRGGHSSIPPKHTSIGKLASALHKLEANPMKPKLTDVFRKMLETAAPYKTFGERFAFNNLWLTKSAVLRRLADDELQRAMVQTTTAVTVFHGGVKANVVPTHAEALVNFRILPGETTEDVVAHVRRVIEDPEIEIESLSWSPAPPPAALEGSGYAVIEEAIHARNPDTILLPALMPGATDTRHFTRIVRDAYRFVPVRVGMDLMEGFHGKDERIPVAPLGESVAIAVEMMRRAANPDH